MEVASLNRQGKDVVMWLGNVVKGLPRLFETMPQEGDVPVWVLSMHNS